MLRELQVSGFKFQREDRALAEAEAEAFFLKAIDIARKQQKN